MTQESDQVIQRRTNLAALRELGVDAYPARFETRATIEAAVRQYGTETGEALEAQQPATRVVI